MFGAKVCSFYRARAGHVREFGITIPLTAIQQAPVNAPMVWPPKQEADIPLPPIVQEQTGFTFAKIYWEAHGHVPSVYMFPHFDFHFYFIPQQDVNGIDCKDLQKPAALPAGYALIDANVPPIGELIGLCVPYMGMHALPPADLAPEARWAAPLIVGYYRKKPIFIEPMVTQARFLRERSFSLPIPRIEPVSHVRYPAHFRAIYLAKSKTYDFIFSY